jgi:hypothetical protein
MSVRTHDDGRNATPPDDSVLLLLKAGLAALAVRPGLLNDDLGQMIRRQAVCDEAPARYALLASLSRSSANSTFEFSASVAAWS